MATAFMIVPFLGGSVFNSQTKVPLVLALFVIPAMTIIPSREFISKIPWGVLIALSFKEILLGFLIGYISGLVFWAVQSAGFLMDNQRGASMAAGPDPLSGEETSPLGSFLFQSVTVLFFVGGGFMGWLRFLWSSYTIWPPLTFLPILETPHTALFLASLIDWLMLQTFLLAGPVAAICLLTDVSLGLINRFASQLNVYVLAMPIKSGMAMFILVAYYSLLLSLGPDLFGTMLFQLETLMRLLEGS
jgi:type III secretion protein T